MSNTQVIQVVFLALIVFSLIFSILLQIGRKQIRETQNYSVFLAGKAENKGAKYYLLYDFFKEWQLTKRYISKLTRQYEIIIPGDRMEVKKQTIKTALIIWLLDAVLVTFLFALSPSLFRAIITIAYIYVVNNQTFYLILNRNELKILSQLEKAIGDIRHKYYELNGMVDEAINEVIETAEYPIKLHLSKIHDVLNHADIDDEISKYEETVPNRFLNIFLSLCVMIMKFGDKKMEDKSIFLTNLRYLRQEINIELTNRRKEKWLFSFLIVIAVIPILALKSIERWAISCFDVLTDYYRGAFGISTVFIIFLLTIASYNLVNRLKDNLSIEVKNYVLLDWLSKTKFFRGFLNNVVNKNFGKTLRTEELLKKSGESITVKQLLLKRVLCGFVTFFGCVVLAFIIHGQERHNILNNTELGMISSMVSEKQEEEIKSNFIQYIREHIDDKDLDIEEIQNNFLEKGVIKSQELATLTAQEVVDRINAYHNTYYRWYEFFLAIMLGVVAFYIPYIKIIALKRLRKMVIDDEIIQYHSIILMLMHMDKMSIEIILIWMEKFSNVFKRSLQKCINNLQCGDIEALEELKKQEPYVRIIENLQMCDKLPVPKAFDEINAERYNYQENRKLDNEIFLEKKVLIAQIIAWTPAIFTLVVYLILPWLIQALLYVFQQMDQMQRYL